MLRAFRVARGMSQLALSLEAGVSARHLSFVETGRAKPSRELLLALAEALDVPLRDRNALLEAAGFAAAYRETPLAAPSMEQVRAALSQLLRASMPNPTLVVNRRYDVLLANDAAQRLIGRFCAAPVTGTPNLARLLVSSSGLRPFVRNYAEVATYVVERMRREIATSRTRDADDEALLRELSGEARPKPNAHTEATEQVLVPVKLARDGVTLHLFATITTLGTPLDVTLQELRVETFFPADAASADTLRAITA